jgi:hypothetical protein
VRRTSVVVSIAFSIATSASFAGHTILVSAGPNGQANGSVTVQGLSSDGSRVLYLTTANNLAPSDTEFKQDAFVFDRNTGSTLHVSIDDPAHPMDATAYVAQAVISGDGSTVYFVSVAPADLFVHDVASGVTERLVDGGAGLAVLALGGCSDDGTRVTFTAEIAGLDPADPTPDQDVYVHDLVSGTTSLVNKDANGQTLAGPAYLPQISGDGRYVVFSSPAAYAPGTATGDDLFRKDLLTGAVVAVNPLKSVPWTSIIPHAVSADGSKVLMTSDDATWEVGDTNGVSDIFLWDASTSTVELVSRNAAGVVGDAPSFTASMSSDGNWIVWRSSATNFIPGDVAPTVRVILKDRAGNRLHSCAVPNSGGVPNGFATSAGFVTNDGTAVAFSSSATNLVVGDTTGVADAYVHRVRSFHDLGYGVAGVGGIPQLTGTGTLDVGDPLSIGLTQAASNAPMLLCASLAETPETTFGGTFVALPLAVSLVVATDATGSFGFSIPTPGPQLPNLYLQCLIADPAAADGVSMSNAIVGAAF